MYCKISSKSYNVNGSHLPIIIINIIINNINNINIIII